MGSGDTGVLGRARAALGAGTNPSVGQAIKSVAGSAGTGLRAAGQLARSPFAAGAAGIAGAIQGLDTDTKQYAKRFGLENTEPGVLRDVGIRSLGVASDVGNSLLMGAPQALGAFRDKNEPTTPKPASTTTGKPARPTNRMGQGFDDPRLVDRDPSRQSLGASRDFTNELAGAPKQLPGGLREGVVYKTKDANGRTVYSGANISGDIQMVDGMGRNLQTRGDVNTLPGMSKEAVSRALTNPDGSRWTANDNAIMAANLRDGIDPYRGTSRGNAQAQGGMSAGMASIAAAEQKLGVPLGKARRAQAAIDQQGAIAERTNQTTLRGQDMELQGRLLPKQMEMEMAQRMRQLNAQIYQQSGGDPRKAQEMALRMGMDGEAFGKLADANQARSDKSRQQTRDLLAPAAITKDKDGNDVINPARQAQVEAAVRDAYPNFESLPPAEKAAAAQRVLAMENIRAAANDRKDVGLRKATGLDTPAFAMNTLPEFVGPAEEVGFWEGLTTIGAERGDLRVPVKGGGTQHLNRGRLTQAELETLKNNGAQLRGAN